MLTRWQGFWDSAHHTHTHTIIHASLMIILQKIHFTVWCWPLKNWFRFCWRHGGRSSKRSWMRSIGRGTPDGEEAFVQADLWCCNRDCFQIQVQVQDFNYFLRLRRISSASKWPPYSRKQGDASENLRFLTLTRWFSLRRKVAFVMKTQLQKFEAFSSDQVSAKKGSPTNLQKQVGRGTWLVSPLTACAENRNSVFWMLARCGNPRGNLTASNRKKLFVGRRAASFGISVQIVEISINWFALIPLLWGNLGEQTLCYCIPSAKVSTYWIAESQRKFWRLERG